MFVLLPLSIAGPSCMHRHATVEAHDNILYNRCGQKCRALGPARRPLSSVCTAYVAPNSRDAIGAQAAHTTLPCQTCEYIHADTTSSSPSTKPSTTITTTIAIKQFSQLLCYSLRCVTNVREAFMFQFYEPNWKMRRSDRLVRCRWCTYNFSLVLQGYKHRICLIPH